MKKKSLPLVILTSLLALGGLVGCGEEQYDVTITFWHSFGKTPADSIEAQAKKFCTLVEKNEGVKVGFKFMYKGSYDDVLSNVKKSFVSGETPTISVAYPDHVADYFAAEGNEAGKYVVNLDDYINDPEIGFGKEAYLGDNNDASDFVESFFQEGKNYTREGTYSLPYMKSSEVLFYNMTAVRKFMPYYDASASTDDDIREIMENFTWDEFMDFCEVINDNKEEFPSLTLAPCFYDSDANYMISKMYQKGIGYSSISDEGYGVIDFNGNPNGSFVPSEDQKAEYKKVFDFLKETREYYDAGLMTTKGVVGEYGSNNFTLQKTIFSIGSSGGAGYNFPATATFDVGICKVPSSSEDPDNRNLYVSQGPTLCMFNNASLGSENNTKAKKYAWKFLKYITNDEVNADLCVNGSEGYIPVRESSYTTQTFIDFMENGEKYAATAKTVISDIDGAYINTPVFKGSAALRDSMAGCLADVLKIKSADLTDDAIYSVLNRAIQNAVSKM